MQFPGADIATAMAELTQARDILRTTDSGWAESMSEVGLGLLTLALGQVDDARGHFERGLEVAQAKGDTFTMIATGNQCARLMLMRGEVDEAHAQYTTNLGLGAALHFDEGVAYGLEGMSAIAALRGDAWRAGALAVVAASIRQRIGVFDVEGFAVHLPPLAALRESDPDAVAAGERAGAEMTVPEAIAIALPDADTAVRDALAQW
jgi:hypothetical protein